MNKNVIEKIVLVGGILIATVGLLTGCGKKDNETIERSVITENLHLQIHNFIR